MGIGMFRRHRGYSDRRQPAAAPAASDVERERAKAEAARAEAEKAKAELAEAKARIAELEGGEGAAAVPGEPTADPAPEPSTPARKKK